VVQVLLSVVHGAVEFPDPAAQKICFALLRKIIEEWGASEEAPNNFVDFMFNQVTPCSLRLFKFLLAICIFLVLFHFSIFCYT
jgi:hypothetical protein